MGNKPSTVPERIVFGRELDEIYEKPYCLHPNSPAGCSPKVIAAHTVQRKRMLEKIAMDGHVYGVTRDFQDFLNGKPIIRWGIKKASVRPFLCDTHDDALFTPMEKEGFRVCREHCFLLAYRAILNGIYLTRAKREVAKLYKQKASQSSPQRKTALIADADWKTEEAKFRDQQVEREKRIYDQALLTGDLSRLHFYLIEFQQCRRSSENVVF